MVGSFPVGYSGLGSGGLLAGVSRRYGKLMRRSGWRWRQLAASANAMQLGMEVVECWWRLCLLGSACTGVLFWLHLPFLHCHFLCVTITTILHFTTIPFLLMFCHSFLMSVFCDLWCSDRRGLHCWWNCTMRCAVTAWWSRIRMAVGVSASLKKYWLMAWRRGWRRLFSAGNLLNQ